MLIKPLSVKKGSFLMPVVRDVDMHVYTIFDGNIP